MKAKKVWVLDPDAKMGVQYPPILTYEPVGAMYQPAILIPFDAAKRLVEARNNMSNSAAAIGLYDTTVDNICLADAMKEE